MRRAAVPDIVATETPVSDGPVGEDDAPEG